MSRTGNLLFPDDSDDGWVTSIQKALPKEDGKKDAARPEDTLGGIPDPVADAADAVFAELAAEVATQEAIFASGWSADAVKVETKPPEASETPAPRDAARTALESVVNPEVEGGEDLDFGDDPVAAAADAAFAEISAETAARDAIEAAGWTADAAPSVDVVAEIENAQPPAPEPASSPALQEADFAGWSAAVVRGEQEILLPEELEALDAVSLTAALSENSDFHCSKW